MTVSHDDPLDLVYDTIDTNSQGLGALDRRKLIAGAAATIGGMGALGMIPQIADAQSRGDNNPETILNIAATAEALATIVNTLGPEKLDLDPVTKLNVQAAAREELLHYEAILSLGGRALTTTIWVPDEVFASKENFLNTLVAGDQIFINAYLLGTTVFARSRNSKAARYAAEIMGVEAVHRALALQSLGKLGNDRAYMAFEFKNINTAVRRLQAAGFGFGQPGSKPGTAYTYAEVSRRTPDPEGVNTRTVA